MLGIEVTAKEHLDIERETRSQGYNEKWHSVRYKRITGSICGRILCQKKKTVSLLVYCLYPKPIEPLPPPIVWGRQHESIAVKKYLAIKNPPGTPCTSCTTVESCGFIVHPQHCWLGASPDGKVKDLSSKQPDGILEIKCPYSNVRWNQKKPAKIQHFTVN